MVEVPLTRGRVALIDDEDAERVLALKWTLSGDGRYAYRTENRLSLYLHRFLLDPPPGSVVDHVNGDGLDNRRANLRVVSHRANMANSKPRKGTSRFKGVGWKRDKQKWKARLAVGGREIHLGYFETEEEAARAYDAAARIHFGPTARLNYA